MHCGVSILGLRKDTWGANGYWLTTAAWELTHSSSNPVYLDVLRDYNTRTRRWIPVRTGGRPATKRQRPLRWCWEDNMPKVPPLSLWKLMNESTYGWRLTGHHTQDYPFVFVVPFLPVGLVFPIVLWIVYPEEWRVREKVVFVLFYLLVIGLSTLNCLKWLS